MTLLIEKIVIRCDLVEIEKKKWFENISMDGNLKLKYEMKEELKMS